VKSVRSIAVVLFDEFELLDVFGPLEMFGMVPDSFEICMVAERTGEVASRQGPKSVVEHGFSEGRQYDIVLVPGGKGTRTEVDNQTLLAWLRKQSSGAEYVTSVCTGSAILARAGVLDGVRATTNKRAFTWATAQGDKVNWQKEARWVEDGKFFTSSGVSAGMDMSLALIAKLLGQATAEEVATWTEYEWHRDAGWDPFAKVYGLV
jgi:transcriptional regulator GlxA family with amidase domain